MRFVPFLKKRKQNADTATPQVKEPDPSDACVSKGNAQLPKIFHAGPPFQEDYFTYKSTNVAKMNGLRQSSTSSRIVLAIHDRTSQKSRSFADLRSFTDEYIQRKYILLSGGAIGRAACPSYTAYPPLSILRSSAGSSISGDSAGSSISGDSTGSSTLAVSLDSSTASLPVFCKVERTASGTSIMTRADALCALYAPIADGQRVKKARRPLQYAIESAFGISPTASQTIGGTRMSREQDQSIARMLARFASKNARIPSLIREASSMTDTDDSLHKCKQSMSVFSRFFYAAKLRFRSHGSSGLSSSSSTAVSMLAGDEGNTIRWRNMPPPAGPNTVYLEAVKILERGRVPEGYVMPFPFPGACYLAFPCPKSVRERTRKNRTQQILNYVTLHTIIVCEVLTMFRLLLDFDTLGGDDAVLGPLYVLGASSILFIAFCCTVMHLLSYWTQLEWARGKRNMALIFPKNSLSV